MGVTAPDAVTMTARTASGRRIHVDPADRRGRVLVDSHGDFNPPSLVLWHQALRLHAWDVVVDVGVNYGEMLVGAPIPDGARVVGFEPNPALHAYVRSTFADNGLVVDLREEAVSDHHGTARFAVDRDWSGTSTLTPGTHDPERWRWREVTLTTLESVLAGSPSWCVKVDVEGGELAAIRGSAEAMAGAPHWAMLVEVLHMPVPDLARLAQAHPLYLLDTRTRALVRVPGGHVDLARTMLRSGWLYPQDALLVSPAVRDLVGP